MKLPDTKTRLAQRPNAPLLIALVGAIIALALPDHLIGDLAAVFAYASILIWAFLEFYASPYQVRRLMGLVVLVALVVLAVLTLTGAR